jgi:hypothetical protein
VELGGAAVFCSVLQRFYTSFHALLRVEEHARYCWRDAQLESECINEAEPRRSGGPWHACTGRARSPASVAAAAPPRVGTRAVAWSVRRQIALHAPLGERQRAIARLASWTCIPVRATTTAPQLWRRG